jgi:hypothetical protein
MTAQHLRYPRATAAFTAADRAIRTQKDRKAVRDIWLFLASVIVFLTLVNVARKVAAWLHASRHIGVRRSVVDAEKRGDLTPSQQRPATSTISRLLSSTTTAFRIVAFRVPIPIGLNALATVSELAFIFAYIAANFLWLFLDSEYQ